VSASKTHPFVWYELMTTDVAAAVSFYQSVAGWKAQAAGIGPVPYTVLSVGEAGIGGVLELTAEMCAQGAAPVWVGYVGVDDVDGHVERLRAAGGSVQMGPMDLHGAGAFAVVADPHGAAFGLLKPSILTPLQTIAPGTQGSIGWRELHAGDGEAAFQFYGTLFGWSESSRMDMGPLGVYRMFSTGGEGSPAVGGMMTRMPDSPRPFWLYYIEVDHLGAGMERATAAGGKLLMGPHEVPGPMYIAQFFDPQGALFALVSAVR
jgi:predicted enzyme related to lactoylglutathione lyase